ncbi:MAG: hypothetical protein QM667_11690 [Asticcacaulis sp.]
MTQMTRRALSGLFPFLGMGALGMSGCAKKRHPNYHYKLTLNFESEGHIYSGSSVVEVKSLEGQTIGNGNVYQEKLKGEGVLVDFGGGKVILSLLEWNLNGGSSRTLTSKIDIYQLVALREARALTIEQLPVMITFDDVGNPASYRIIEVNKETGEVLPGIKFVSAVIEITDEHATFVIEKKIPALKSVENYLSGQRVVRVSLDNRWVSRYDLIRTWWL